MFQGQGQKGFAFQTKPFGVEDTDIVQGPLVVLDLECLGSDQFFEGATFGTEEVGVDAFSGSGHWGRTNRMETT